MIKNLNKFSLVLHIIVINIMLKKWVGGTSMIRLCYIMESYRYIRVSITRFVRWQHQFVFIQFNSLSLVSDNITVIGQSASIWSGIA